MFNMINMIHTFCLFPSSNRYFDNISQTVSLYIPEPTCKWDEQLQWLCWSQAEALATFRIPQPHSAACSLLLTRVFSCCLDSLERSGMMRGFRLRTQAKPTKLVLGALLSLGWKTARGSRTTPLSIHQERQDACEEGQ